MNRLSVIAAAGLVLSGCGYHVAGNQIGTPAGPAGGAKQSADSMPKTIQTVAIPAFGNTTTRYQLARLLPADLTREFIARTKYAIIADPTQADAVLTGALTNFAAFAAVYDPISGRATGVQVIVTMQITLTERATGKLLFQRTGYEIRERYELSVNPQAYFDESGTAIQRVSKDAAQSIVTAILENF